MLASLHLNIDFEIKLEFLLTIRKRQKKDAKNEIWKFIEANAISEYSNVFNLIYDCSRRK